MIDKLLEAWTTFGIKVTDGYATFVKNVGVASIIIAPFYLLGFVIPWFIVTAILVALDILYGRIVYDLGFKEQWKCFKEGLVEGMDETER